MNINEHLRNKKLSSLLKVFHTENKREHKMDESFDQILKILDDFIYKKS